MDTKTDLLHADFANILMHRLQETQDSLFQAADAFVNAIDWKEPLVLGLSGFNVLALASVVLTRKSINLQALLFLLFTLIVFCLDYLNDFGRTHWFHFATTNYFDPSGFFLAMLLGVPLLCCVVIISFNILFRSVLHVVEIKRQQILNNNNNNNKNNTSCNGNKEKDHKKNDAATSTTNVSPRKGILNTNHSTTVPKQERDTSVVRQRKKK